VLVVLLVVEYQLQTVQILFFLLLHLLVVVQVLKVLPIPENLVVQAVAVVAQAVLEQLGKVMREGLGFNLPLITVVVVAVLVR
jgi:hypothetical protein